MFFRPYNVSFLWASRINDEFFQQTDKERELGLPVTPFMVSFFFLFYKFFRITGGVRL
jgi:hypothetical protein